MPSATRAAGCRCSCVSIPDTSTCRSEDNGVGFDRRSIGWRNPSTTALSACGSGWSAWAVSSPSRARGGEGDPGGRPFLSRDHQAWFEGWKPPKSNAHVG